MVKNLIENLLKNWIRKESIAVYFCELTDEYVKGEPDALNNKKHIICKYESSGAKKACFLEVFTQDLKGDLRNILSTLNYESLCLSSSEQLLSVVSDVMNSFTDHFPIPPSATFQGEFGRITIRLDLVQDKFKEGIDTDPDGFVFGKSVEILRFLATFHAASAIALKDQHHLVSETLPESIQLIYNTTATEDITQNILFGLMSSINREKSNFFPPVINVCDFRPSNLLLRYRGCGMWDVCFKIISCNISSPLLDLVFFVCQCSLRDVAATMLDELLQIYLNRFIEVSQMLGSLVKYDLVQFQENTKKLLKYFSDQRCIMGPT